MLKHLQSLREILSGIEIAFSADLFTQGMYFGACEGERIIAAGGTHTLTPAYQIAVLGHILTAPEARRQGYATAITAGLVTTLLQQHCSTVALNVFEDNRAALSIYQHLGFKRVIDFLQENRCYYTKKRL